MIIFRFVGRSVDLPVKNIVVHRQAAAKHDLAADANHVLQGFFVLDQVIDEMLHRGVRLRIRVFIEEVCEHAVFQKPNVLVKQVASDRRERTRSPGFR